MADRGSDVISVNSEILCTVQHITDDLMVVRFTDSNNKSYQGVLLDSTKRCYPNSLSIVLIQLKLSDNLLTVEVPGSDS